MLTYKDSIHNDGDCNKCGTTVKLCYFKLSREKNRSK